MNINALTTQLKVIYKKQGLIYFLTYVITAVNHRYLNKLLRGSYSQKGEDLIIEKLLGKKRKGFYIDVGAHNPSFFSNTKRFYDKGWRGINIEPNPLLISRFLTERKKDTNLNIGVSEVSGVLKFYEMDPDSLSTFSKKEKEAKIKLGYELKSEHKVKVLSLKKVISKYVRRKIDFISVDTEGYDLEVLKTNDWKKYRPTLVCVETGDFESMVGGKDTKKKKLINQFMKKNGYLEAYSNGLNTIYKQV